MTAFSFTKSFPKDETRDVIAQDFMRRSSLVTRGIDPSRLGYILRSPELQSRISPRAKRFHSRLGAHIYLKTGLSYFTQSIYMHFSSVNAKSTAMRIGKAVSISAMQLATRGTRIAIIRLASFMGGPIAKPFIRIIKKERGRKLFESNTDTAREFGKKGHLHTRGEGYFERMDDRQALFCRFLHEKETRVRPHAGVTEHHELRDDYAAHKILDPYGAPQGSIIELRKINAANVLHVRQPDGLEIYILPGKKVAYARYREELEDDFDKPMHRQVQELMHENSHAIRVYGQDKTVHVEDICHEDFESLLDAETMDPTVDDIDIEPAYDTQALKNIWAQCGMNAPGLTKKAKCLSFSMLNYAFGKVAPEPETHRSAGFVKRLVTTPLRRGEVWTRRHKRANIDWDMSRLETRLSDPEPLECE